ncbi:hypothetical protein GCM10010353_50320 [Streptomyces chryseus]|nr:hypothetical protein GCM10010353_50320 [Streptomyces chryseus]
MVGKDCRLGFGMDAAAHVVSLKAGVRRSGYGTLGYTARGAVGEVPGDRPHPNVDDVLTRMARCVYLQSWSIGRDR